MAAIRRTLVPGQQLQNGRYTVVGPLSKGGMGAIFLATQRIAHSTRDVVLKVMLGDTDPADQAALKEITAQFSTEAQTLAELRHPNIAQIYDFFVEQGTPVIVMEYITGKSLDEHLTHYDDQGQQVAGRPFAQADVLAWGMLLCDVLAYLADRQPAPVVHHDIKPANIILDGQRLCLVDFGSAKIRRAAGPGGYNRTTLFGTPGYAPPEQYQGQSEPRSDIYALAATLYHLATNRAPSDGIGVAQLQALGALGGALAPAFARDPARRPSAAELKLRLQALIPGGHASPGAHLLIAPGGAKLADTTALVAWCCQNWRAASAWLGSTLPEQIKVHWQDHALGDQLLGIAKAPGQTPGKQLDAALALLDPQGFGAAAPSLVLHGPSVQPGPQGELRIDFGGLAADGRQSLRIAIANTGSRYIEAAPTLPRWLSASPERIVLSPGERAQVTLSADMGLLPATSVLANAQAGGAIAHELLLAGQKVIVQAQISPWRTGLHRLGQALAELGRLALRLGKLVGLGLGVLLGALIALLSHEAVLLMLGAMLLGGVAGAVAGLICWLPLGALSGWLPGMIDAGVPGWAADLGVRVLRWGGSRLDTGASLRAHALALGLGMASIYATAGALTGLVLALFSRSPLKPMLVGVVPGAGIGCLLGLPAALVLWLLALVLMLFGGGVMATSTAVTIVLSCSLAGLFVGAVMVAIDY